MTPEPISTAIVTGGLEAGVSAAKGLVERLFGPAADELGAMLSDKARLYRLKNTLRVLAKTQELLSNAKIEGNQVPLRTLLPILDGAAMEDDESLSAKWAGLLASAAASPPAVHPSFPRILSELTPREAAMLDELLAADGPNAWPDFRALCAQRFNCPEQSIKESWGNLFRLGIWANAKDPSSEKSLVKLSEFGRAFLTATHGPKTTSS